MRWLKRLFGSRPDPPAEARKPEAQPAPDPVAARLIGPPKADTPFVLRQGRGGQELIDRLAFEFEQGRRPGTDPNLAELAAQLVRAERVRIMRGGLWRETPFGVEVLADSQDRALLDELRLALAPMEEPFPPHHFLGFGDTTLEFFQGEECVAALALHSHSYLRWPRWSTDVRVAQPESLRSLLARFRPQDGDPDCGLDLTLKLLAFSEAERHAMRGESLRALGQLARAEEECRQALKLEPTCWEALLIRAQAAAQQGRLAEAEADCTAALEAGGAVATTRLSRGQIRREAGKLPEALEDLRAAAAAAPKEGEIQSALALTLIQLGRAEEARSAFDEAIRLSPDPRVPLWNRAELELQAGGFSKAAELLTELVALLKKDAEGAEGAEPTPAETSSSGLTLNLCGAYLQRSRAYANLLRHEEALRDLARAQRQEPTNPLVYEWRAAFHRQRDEFDDALSDCDRMAELAPDQDRPWLLRSQIRAEAGDLDGALADLRRAMPLSDEPHRLHGVAAELLLGAGRFEEAREELDALLEKKPDEAIAYFLRSQCWRRLGLYAEQLEDLRRGLQADPEHGLLLNSLAWLHATCPDAALRDGAKAVAAGLQALKLEKGVNPHLLDTLAAAYAEQGDFDEACQYMRRAVAAFKAMLPPAALEPYRQRLALFEAGEPFREE